MREDEILTKYLMDKLSHLRIITSALAISSKTGLGLEALLFPNYVTELKFSEKLRKKTQSLVKHSSMYEIIDATLASMKYDRSSTDLIFNYRNYMLRLERVLYGRNNVKNISVSLGPRDFGALIGTHGLVIFKEMKSEDTLVGYVYPMYDLGKPYSLIVNPPYLSVINPILFIRGDVEISFDEQTLYSL